jgi:hypothetical protein
LYIALIAHRRRQLEIQEERVSRLLYDFNVLGKKIKKQFDIFDVIYRQVEADKITLDELKNKEKVVADDRIMQQARKEWQKKLNKKKKNNECN